MAGKDYSRPEYASPLGCTPGRTFNDECPTRMECLRDASYERGGRCDCNPLWFKYAGKLPFDGAEFDDGFSTRDCLNHHPSRFFASMFYLAIVSSLVGFIYTNVTVIKELIRVKALKWNATAYSLSFLLWASISSHRRRYPKNTRQACMVEHRTRRRGITHTEIHISSENVLQHLEVAWHTP